MLGIHKRLGEEVFLHGTSKEPHLLGEELPQDTPILVAVDFLKFQILVPIRGCTSKTSTYPQPLPELPVHLTTSPGGALEDGTRANRVLHENLELVVGSTTDSIECNDPPDERVVLGEADAERRGLAEDVECLLYLGETLRGLLLRVNLHWDDGFVHGEREASRPGRRGGHCAIGSGGDGWLLRLKAWWAQASSVSRWKGKGLLPCASDDHLAPVELPGDDVVAGGGRRVRGCSDCRRHCRATGSSEAEGRDLVWAPRPSKMVLLR